MKNPQDVNILLIEDDIIEVKMFKRSFRRLKLENPLHVAGNGEEGLALLRSEQVLKPCIILLDLNMPRMSGIEFLDILRKDSALSMHIVFVMTTSNSDTDKAQAYRYNVAGYMVKSELGDNYSQAVSLIANYLSAVELPN